MSLCKKSHSSEQDWHTTFIGYLIYITPQQVCEW
jgi:hypothetical protein